jgi:hypothetical protein
VQAWPPNSMRPMLTRRYYDSMTVGCYDTVAAYTYRPNPPVGTSTQGLQFAPFFQWTNGSVTFTQAGIDQRNTSGVPADAQVAIYESSGGAPSRLLHTTQVVTIANGFTGIVDLPFTTPVTLKPGLYWIGIWFDGGANTRINCIGWAKGTGTTHTEGFTTLGMNTPISGGTVTKRFFWNVTKLTLPLMWNTFPDTLQILPAGTALELEDQVPRIVLRVL